MTCIQTSTQLSIKADSRLIPDAGLWLVNHVKDHLRTIGTMSKLGSKLTTNQVQNSITILRSQSHLTKPIFLFSAHLFLPFLQPPVKFASKVPCFTSIHQSINYNTMSGPGYVIFGKTFKPHQV